MSRLHGFDIYLKTGTAQTSDLSKRDQGKRFVEHGWVTLYFKYKNEEPHTLVIIVENIGSSSSATAIAYKILRKYHLSHAPSQPQQTTISNDA
jgi:cell division protein FtsI/penicillin-binding protein 2